MDQRELPGMPTAVAKPRKGSAAWTRGELERYKDLSVKHRGLTTQLFASIILGVSKQRVHQLVKAGRIASFEILDRTWLPVDAVEAFDRIERGSSFRYSVDAQVA